MIAHQSGCPRRRWTEHRPPGPCRPGRQAVPARRRAAAPSSRERAGRHSAPEWRGCGGLKCVIIKEGGVGDDGYKQVFGRQPVVSGMMASPWFTRAVVRTGRDPGSHRRANPGARRCGRSPQTPTPGAASATSDLPTLITKHVKSSLLVRAEMTGTVLKYMESAVECML